MISRLGMKKASNGAVCIRCNKCMTRFSSFEVKTQGVIFLVKSESGVYISAKFGIKSLNQLQKSCGPLVSVIAE